METVYMKGPKHQMLPHFTILLLSGGPDSVILLYYLVSQGVKVHALIVKYGQRHEQETIWATHHCHRLGVLFTTIELPQFKGSTLTDGNGGVVVPFRNAIMLSHAINLAVAAGAESVAYACNADDDEVFPDCRRAFVQAFNHLLLSTEIPVEVCAPFMDKRKWEIFGLARELGVNLDETWSCYRGGEKPCGECPACKKRQEALNR